MEAIRTFKSNPYLVIGTHHIPTWTTPLLLIFVVAVMMPGTSLLGHLCGVAVGYVGMCASATFRGSKALTSINSRTWVHKILGPSRVGSPLGRVAPKSTRQTPPLCQYRPEDIRALWRPADQQPRRRERSNGTCRQYSATGTLSYV
jgi:hypothetical protein